MKLRDRLLKGEFDNKTLSNSNSTIETNNQNYIKANTFNEAFAVARKQLGPNQIFEYNGKKYTTNLVGEKFEPSEEVLTKNNMNNPEVKKSLKN